MTRLSPLVRMTLGVGDWREEGQQEVKDAANDAVIFEKKKNSANLLHAALVMWICRWSWRVEKTARSATLWPFKRRAVVWDYCDAF